MLIGLGKMVKRVAGGFSLLASKVLGYTTIPGSGGSGYYVTTVGANTNALVMFSDTTGWVSYSYDDGKSWELSFQVPNAGISTDAYVVGGKLVIRPKNTGTQEVYVSTDGKTYDTVMVGDYADLGTRIYTVGDYIYISGKQGQTYFSKNGTDWQSVSIETEYSDGNLVYDLAINYTKSRDKEGIYWATTTNSAQIRYYKENLLSDTVVFSDAGYLNGSATLTSKVYYNNGNYYVASSDRKSTYYVSESANFNSSLEWQKSTIQDSNGNSITSFTDDGTLDLYGANFVHQTDEFNKPNSDWYTGGILAWFRTNYQSQGGTYSYEFFVTNDGATWKKVNYSLDLVTGNIKVIQAPSGSYILSAKNTSYWFEIWGWLSNPGSTYLSLSQFSLFDGYLRYDSNLQINFIRTEAEVAAEFVPAGQYVVVDRANGIIWKGRSQFDPFQFAGQIDTGNISLTSLQKAKYQNGTYSVQAIDLYNFNGAGLYSSTDLAAWTSQTLPVGNFSTKFGTQVQPINTLVEIQTAIGDQNNDTAEILAPVDVYTVPAGKITTLQKIALANTTSSPLTYDLGLLSPGKTLTQANSIKWDEPISASATDNIVRTDVLIAGEKITVLPSTVDAITATVYGTEVNSYMDINLADYVSKTYEYNYGFVDFNLQLHSIDDVVYLSVSDLGADFANLFPSEWSGGNFSYSPYSPNNGSNVYVGKVVTLKGFGFVNNTLENTTGVLAGYSYYNPIESPGYASSRITIQLNLSASTIAETAYETIEYQGKTLKTYKIWKGPANITDPVNEKLHTEITSGLISIAN